MEDRRLPLGEKSCRNVQHPGHQALHTRTYTYRHKVAVRALEAAWNGGMDGSAVDGGAAP